MSNRIVCKNKKAFHDYHIESTIEAGIVLTGAEVKSLRAGKANMRDSYAAINKDEVWLYNVHISPYTHAPQTSQDPMRTRKLLLHRREIKKLVGKVQEKGFALIPLKIYFVNSGKVKVEIAMARGKKLYDKRAALKKKETDREIEREFKRR